MMKGAVNEEDIRHCNTYGRHIIFPFCITTPDNAFLHFAMNEIVLYISDPLQLYELFAPSLLWLCAFDWPHVLLKDQTTFAQLRMHIHGAE